MTFAFWMVLAAPKRRVSRPLVGDRPDIMAKLLVNELEGPPSEGE